MNKSFGNRYIALAFLAVVAMSTGCTGLTTPKEYGTSISAEEMASFVKGKTTEEELLRKYGNPDQTLNLNAHTKEISYIKKFGSTEAIMYGLQKKPKNVEYWFQISKGLVQDFGQRETTKEPIYVY